MATKWFASVLAASLGLALLGGGVHAAAGPSAAPHRGGTLRVNLSGTDFELVDPGLAYNTFSWTMLYTTQLLLVNFPETNGQAGTVLYPEAAASFPIVSRDGRTYTFHLRPGLKFSDGTPVTAASYRRAWERALSPKMAAGSPVGVNDQFQYVLQGGVQFLAGKTKHISGITAKGLTIVFRLVKPNPTFTSYLGMQWFGAVKPNMPYTSTGLNVYPSAGPYYIQSRVVNQSLVEARNPYYKGPRPANPDKIVWTTNTDFDQSLLQVEAGQADIDGGGPPPTANAQLAAKYGLNKTRFFVGPTSCIFYLALNTSRPPFSNVAFRRAVNWAIDRPALVRLMGKYGGKRSDQILVPGVDGYKPYDIYSIRGANLAKAKKLVPNGIPGTVVVMHGANPFATSVAEVVEYELKKLGVNTRDRPLPGTIYYSVLGMRGVDMDIATTAWCADYFDAFDYINVNFDGRSIQARNNVNFAYLDSPALDRQMDHAASLTGGERTQTYQRLDREIMAKYAPWVPYGIVNGVYLVAKRVHNFVYSDYFGGPYYNALSIG